MISNDVCSNCISHISLFIAERIYISHISLCKLSVSTLKCSWLSYNSTKLNCIGALAFHCDSKKSIGFLEVFLTGNAVRSVCVLTEK